jgi:hypothetical protein
VRRATATLRRRLFTIPGRLVHAARRLHLRLPTNWPWARAFGTAVTSIYALLLRSRTANALPSATRKTSETPADRQLDHAQPWFRNQSNNPDQIDHQPSLSGAAQAVATQFHLGRLLWSGKGGTRCYLKGGDTVTLMTFPAPGRTTCPARISAVDINALTRVLGQVSALRDVVDTACRTRDQLRLFISPAVSSAAAASGPRAEVPAVERCARRTA